MGRGEVDAARISLLQAYPDEQLRTRAALTALLAFIVWWNFLTGHIVNNIRGFGS